VSYIVPILLTLMRFAWLLPWLLLLKSFLSPSYPGNLLDPWLLVAVPLLSLVAVKWANTTPAPATTDTNNKLMVDMPTALAWRTRLTVALLGLATLLGVAWWQYYRASHVLWDVAWLYDLGYALTHWGTEEVPPQAVTILLLITLWLNGIGDAIRSLTHDDVWGALIRSVVGMVLFVVVMAIAQRPLPGDLFYLIVLLFGAGMLALAFSSLKITIGLDRALGMGQRRISATPKVNRYWLSSVLVTVIGLLAAGLLVAIVLAPEQLQALIDAIGFVLSWIGRAIGAVLLALSYVAFFIIYFFFRLLEPLLERMMERMADTPLAEMLAPEQMEQMQEVAEGGAPIPDTYRWIGLAIMVGLIIIAFALALRRLQTESATDEDETRESILTTDLLQDQLSGLWNRLFGGRRTIHDPFLSLDGESAARRRVRAIYQQLLAGAATMGVARTPAETPDEYAHHLQEAWQKQEEALTTITAAYHQARYAPAEPTAAQSEAVAAAWTALSPMLTPTPAAGSTEQPASGAARSPAADQ
jgi:hypothetical protein